MKTPSFKKLIIEKFPEQAGWVGGMITPINSFMDDIVNGLNKRLTIRENLNGDILSFTTSGQYPIKIKWDRPTKPTIGWIGGISRVNGATIDLTTAVTLIWSYNQEGQVQIDNLIGLDDSASKTYKITTIFLVE